MIVKISISREALMAKSHIDCHKETKDAEPSHQTTDALVELLKLIKKG